MKAKGFKILNTKFILTPNKYLFFTFLKNNCMKKIFTLLLLSFFTVSIVSAQSLLNEGFNYSIGNLTTVGAPSWVSFAGGATPVPIKVVEGSLSYAGYDTTVGTNRVQLDTVAKNGQAAFVRFSTQKAGTIYYSFLLNVLEYANLAGGNSTRGEWFISLLPNILNSPSLAALQIKRGKRNETFNLGIAARDSIKGSSLTSWYDSSLSTNNTYLVVVGYQVVPGDNNNVISLWVNPRTDTTGLGSPNATVTDSDLGNDSTNIGKIGLFQNSSRTPSCLIDALKVGLSFNDLVLPLRLLSFNVIDNNGFASLSWQTCNEINVKTFEIQRSPDARNFVTIGGLVAKNSGSCGTTYLYRDAKELAGTAFYRIHVVDNDGKSFYSAIVSINGKLPTKINVFPNPVVNNLVLSHPKAGDGALIKIVSLNGSVVATHSVQKDAVQTSVDVSKLAKGNYIVIFSNAQQQQTIKILKQ